jgi:hypothetical protein
MFECEVCGRRCRDVVSVACEVERCRRFRRRRVVWLVRYACLHCAHSFEWEHVGGERNVESI